MMPTMYRLWAKTRLRHLEPWVKTSAVDEICAGVGGQGGSDAAYATAVLLEYAKLIGGDVSGGAADIYKCFGQILRPLVYTLLEKAGFPNAFWKPIANFKKKCYVTTRLPGAWVRDTKKSPVFLSAIHSL